MIESGGMDLWAKFSLESPPGQTNPFASSSRGSAGSELYQLSSGAPPSNHRRRCDSNLHTLPDHASGIELEPPYVGSYEIHRSNTHPILRCADFPISG